MTDAKDEPTFDVLRTVITSDPYHQQFQPLLDHIATLTRERDALRENWSGLLIEQANLLRLREEAMQQRDEARKVTDAARALYRASSVDRVSVDDVQEKLSALFAALSEAP